jgi:cyclopropane-fatty-acyl-phospholipid synthase
LSRIIRRIFHTIARHQATALEVVFADGGVYRNRDGPADVQIVFKTRKSEWRSVLLGYVGFFEAYFEGEIDIIGERAMQTLIRLTYTSDYHYVSNPLVFVMRRIAELRDNNRDFAKAKANARAHYGLPHDFFRLLLGEDCLYAEGYWIDGVRDLASAQHERCDYIGRKLRLDATCKLVEVGSGWGYMAMHAAESYGASVVNYGLVPEQNAVMQKRLEERGLADQVRIVEKDHRELADEPETYDRYLSVGVYEHAGRYCQQSWIASIATALKPGGIGMISTTGFIARFPTEYLTIKHVFPGGSLPSLPRTLQLLEEHGLHVVDIEEMGSHYMRTAQEWLARFEAHWPEIRAIDPEIFDEHFRRVWTYYLSGVIENFRPKGGGLDLHHITFTKGRGIYPENRSVIYR